MRRVLPVILTVALVALSAPAVLAEPKVSGYFETVVSYKVGEDNPYTFGKTLYRLNVSGSVSDNVSYYGRIQGRPETNPTVKRVYLTFSNLGAQGLNVSLGRVSEWYSRLNAGSSEFGVGDFDGVSVALPAAPLTLEALYSVNAGTAGDFTSNGDFVGAYAGYSTEVSGFDVGLSGIVKSRLGGTSGVAYGVSGSVGLGSFGNLYAEASKAYDEDTFDKIHVGANIAALEEATGISAWVEYAVKAKELNFSVSRDLVPGLNLWLSGNMPSGGDLALEIGVTASASF